MAPKSAVYTRGPVYRTMLRTALVMLPGTLSMSGYNLADTFFVGRLPGNASLAAMGFSFPVVMLVSCIFFGLSAGIMTPTARALGERRHQKAARLVSSGVLLVVLFSVVLGLLGMTTTGWIFSLFGARGTALSEVQGYMDIWYFGCVTAALSLAGNKLLITVGDSVFASGLMITGMVINIALDPLLIFGWGPVPPMGIRGAALATIGSQACCAAAGLFLLSLRHKLLHFGRIPWRELKSAWQMVFRFAGPAIIGMLLMPIGSTILTRITAEFGNVAVAAVAAAGRLEMVAFVFPMALGVTLMPMVAQNYGARLYSRLRAGRKFSMGFAFFFLTFMAVLYVLFAKDIVVWFSTDPEVCNLMTLCLYIVPWGFWGIEIHRFSGFFYTGCDRPNVSVWLNLLRIVGLTIPFSLVALCFHSIAGLFIARAAADGLSGLVGYLCVRRLMAKLPADGAPPPFQRRREAPLRSARLTAHAVAQAEIDNGSSTQ